MQFITPNGNAKPSPIYLASGILFLGMFIFGIYGLIFDGIEYDNASPVIIYSCYILWLIFLVFLSTICLISGIKSFKRPRNKSMQYKTNKR